jgi:hypothetical protein
MDTEASTTLQAPLVPIASDRPVAFLCDSRLEGGLAGHASANMQRKAMLVCGKTFEALLQDLQEKGAVLKSSKQLSEAIQHLCFFDADPALLQTMVNLIMHGNIQSSDKDGRLVLRLAHYFASNLPPQTKLANMQMKALLAKQVVHKQVNRRLIALRTLSVAASDSDVRTDLQKHIQSVLNDVESQATSGAQSRNDAVTNACMQYACMAAIRQRPSQLLLDHGFQRASAQSAGQASQLDSIVLTGILRAAATARDPVGARHGVALMLKAAEDDPIRIAKFVRECDDHFHSRLTDPLAKVYYIRLCDGLATNSSLLPEQREHFLQKLMSMTSPQTPDREFLQSTQWLLQNHWPSLHAPQQQAIASRLEALIAQAQDGRLNRPMLHATCRTISLVARTLSTIPSGRDRQMEFQQMLQTSLSHRLRFLATVVDCSYVRGEVIKALIWLITATELSETSQLIISGLREQATDRSSRSTQLGPVTIPDSLAHHLLGCLCDRLGAATTQLDSGALGADVSATAAAVIEWVLNLLARWCLEAGELIDTDILVAAWERVVHMATEESGSHTNVAGGAVMTDPGSSPADAAQEVSTSRASFGDAVRGDGGSEAGGSSGVRGCQACLFRSLVRIADRATGLAVGAVEAGEGVPGARRVVEMQMVSVRLQQAVLWFLGEHAPTLCAAMRLGTGPKSEPELDLLLRLQHAATFSAWQVRVTCVEALGKIALLSIASDDHEQAYLALSIYEFLSATNADDNYGLQLATAPIVQLMDRLYTAREWLVLKLQQRPSSATGDGDAVVTETVDVTAGVVVSEDRASRDLGEEVRLKHAKLTQQVRLFCRVPVGYLPMGSESARFVRIDKHVGSDD